MQHEQTTTTSAPLPVRAMLATHPALSRMPAEALVRCIEACYNCDAACTACADACLSESMVDQLRACIRLNLDCADICAATGRTLLRQTATSGNGSDWDATRRQLEACEAACVQCEAECRRHASMHEHCRVCADICAQCAEACRAMLSAGGNA